MCGCTKKTEGPVKAAPIRAEGLKPATGKRHG